MKTIIFAVLLFLGFAACDTSEITEINSFEIRIAEQTPADNLEKFIMKGTEKVFYLHPKLEISEAHISATKIVNWENSRGIEISFNSEGKKLFARITRNNRGKRIGYLLNGELVYVVLMKQEIPGGKTLIPLAE